MWSKLRTFLPAERCEVFIADFRRRGANPCARAGVAAQKLLQVQVKGPLGLSTHSRGCAPPCRQTAASSSLRTSEGHGATPCARAGVAAQKLLQVQVKGLLGLSTHSRGCAPPCRQTAASSSLRTLEGHGATPCARAGAAALGWAAGEPQMQPCVAWASCPAVSGALWWVGQLPGGPRASLLGGTGVACTHAPCHDLAIDVTGDEVMWPGAASASCPAVSGALWWAGQLPGGPCASLLGGTGVACALIERPQCTGAMLCGRALAQPHVTAAGQALPKASPQSLAWCRAAALQKQHLL